MCFVAFFVEVSPRTHRHGAIEGKESPLQVVASLQCMESHWFCVDANFNERAQSENSFRCSSQLVKLPKKNILFPYCKKESVNST